MSFEATHIKVGGAPEGFDAQLILNEVNIANGPLLHIARDDKRLMAMADALRFFAPTVPVITFPAWDCLPYDRVSPNADISATRMATLAALIHDMPKTFIVLSTLNAAMQKIPAREIVRGASFRAQVGHRIDEKALREFLVRMGFTQAPTVLEPGDYAIRGGIIDIYAPGEMGPIRLDLFGDVLDGARRFDPVSQRTTEKLDVIELAPVSEVILDDAAITRFRQNYRIEFGAARTDDPLYEAVSAGRKHQGIEHWLPFFHDRLETVFDYIPNATISMDDQTTAARVSRWETIQDQYETRKFAMAQKGRIDSVYKPIPPDLLYLDDAAWDRAVSGRRVLNFHPLPQASGPSVIDAGGRIGRNFSPERQQENISLFGALASHIKVKLEKGPVVIASYSEGARERISGLIEDEGLAEVIPIMNGTRIGKRGLYLAVWALDHGFETPDLTVISEQDVLGDRLIRQTKKRRKADNFLTEAQSLSPGDLVVHVDHGIGRYHGLEVITAAGAAHECLLIEYAEQARLYLPVENIELLSRYGHEEGLLDKLGGGAWQAKKAKLKQRIRDMAERLIRVAAERELRKAPILNPPDSMWESFCARFPYQETDDQLSAIEDVLNDLDAGRPMDRLICGDVGFGKTEVAMRAAFIAAHQGKQVAILVPTTLLAQQHFENFVNRFNDWPFNIQVLSRFSSAKEQKATLAQITSGQADIVVGTHKLLSADVKFADLGLVIIDEEHRFGVRQKDKFKALRADVDILTLTATPIPRTLNMAMSGMRDLSIIATPPAKRLPIKTFVMQRREDIIREAIMRELLRGGQVYFLHNDIATIEKTRQELLEITPEARIAVGHGQMKERELETVMDDFYHQRYNVLLCTTIIETGIDVPTANTIIMDRADHLGLAQLHQLRGRVGRSHHQAYAYLLTPHPRRMTKDAAKRLEAISSLEDLGAGFALATHDLEIRGAGELLGDGQSGQIASIGFSLYMDMLDKAVKAIQEGKEPVLTESISDDSEIELRIPALIPQDYMGDVNMRLSIYKRLASCQDQASIDELQVELIDRFGLLPEAAKHLFMLASFKLIAKHIGIKKIEANAKGGMVEFAQDAKINPGWLIKLVQSQPNIYQFAGPTKLIVNQSAPFAAARIEWVEQLLLGFYEEGLAA